MEKHELALIAIGHVICPRARADSLCGDGAKVRRKLGWKPKGHFPELAVETVRADFTEAASADSSPRDTALQ